MFFCLNVLRRCWGIVECGGNGGSLPFYHKYHSIDHVVDVYMAMSIGISSFSLGTSCASL